MNKPFKTIEEQIEILNNRGVKTDKSTANILLREGYYSVVNGYKGLFVFCVDEKGDEEYRHGTTFKEIYRLFSFDRTLRMILFKYIAIAESFLKTTTAYKFSEMHQGRHYDYLELNSYRDDGRYPELAQLLIDEIETILGMNPEKKPPKTKLYIKHYLQNYNEVPIWVLMNYLTLGQAIRFFDFQKDTIRYAIADTFTKLYLQERWGELTIKPKKLKQVFDHIKDIRNICAHDERLYCARVSPRNDTTLAHVIFDLDLVLPWEDSQNLRSEIINEVFSCSQDIKTVSMPMLLKQMGLKSIEDLFLQ